MSKEAAPISTASTEVLDCATLPVTLSVPTAPSPPGLKAPLLVKVAAETFNVPAPWMMPPDWLVNVPMTVVTVPFSCSYDPALVTPSSVAVPMLRITPVPLVVSVPPTIVAENNSTTEPVSASMVPPVLVKSPSWSRSVPPALARSVPLLMAPEALGSMVSAIVWFASMSPWLVSAMKSTPIFPAPSIVWPAALISRSVERSPLMTLPTLFDIVNTPVPANVTSPPLTISSVAKLIAFIAKVPALVIVPMSVVTVPFCCSYDPALVTPSSVAGAILRITPVPLVVSVPPTIVAENNSTSEASSASTVPPVLV